MLLLTSVVALEARQIAIADDERDATADGAAAIATMSDEVGDLLLRIQAAAVLDPSAALRQAESIRGTYDLASVGLLRRDPVSGAPSITTAIPSVGPLSSSGPLLSLPGAGRTLAAAVDSVQPAVSSGLVVPDEDGNDHTYALIASATFDDVPPAAVSARRAQATGWVVALLDPTVLAERTLAGSRGSPARIQEGSLVLGAVGDVDASGLSIPVTVSDRTWTVIVDTPGTPVGAVPWLVGAVGALIAIAVAVATHRFGQQMTATRDFARERAGEVDLVARVGPILQESLDLGAVLPAVTVAMADDLKLDVVRIALADDRGRLSEAFTVGSGPSKLPERVTDVPPSPDALVAGEPAVFPLWRGGRAIGAVEVRSSVHLSTNRVDALRTVIDLISAAVSNAQLFRREQETVGQLQELDALKTEFLGTVSHELRTPTVAIEGFAELLRDSWDRLDESQRLDFVNRISRNASSLSTMVRDLLDFARLERRSLVVHPEPVDVSDLVPDIARRIEGVLDDHHVALDVPPGLVANADVAAVERIVTNLLTNAAKFSPSGSDIDLSLFRDDTELVLRVDDRGPGVAPSERRRVFSRFYRGTSDVSRSTRGAGIGLSVVADLVERLGGSVGVTEAPTGGARFEVRFRVSDDPSPHDRSDQETTRSEPS